MVTEARKAIKKDDEYSAGYGSEPAEATGKVVAWLATDPGADRFLGKWIFAPKLCSDLGLLPDWTYEPVGAVKLPAAPAAPGNAEPATGVKRT